MTTLSTLLEKTKVDNEESELLRQLVVSLNSETTTNAAELVENHQLSSEQTEMIKELLIRRKAAGSLRDFLLAESYELDALGHQLQLPEPLQHELCLAADMTTGWGPSCPDWESNKTPFLSWFWDWLWQGSCPTCHGQGRLPWIEYRQADGSYQREESPICFQCEGSGRQERQ